MTEISFLLITFFHHFYCLFHFVLCYLRKIWWFMVLYIFLTFVTLSNSDFFMICSFFVKSFCFFFSENKGRNINCKTTDCMVVRDSSTCKLLISDTELKRVKRFRYLGIVLAEVRKCDMEIQMCIGIVKAEF